MRVEQAPFALALVFVSACVAAPAVAGAQTVVEGSSKRVTVACGSQGVRVSGLSNEVTLTGACADVTVDGSSNTVHIATLGRLSLAGSKNRVIWADGIGGRAPRIDKSGTGNIVERKAGMTSRLEAPAPASGQAGNAGTAIVVGRDRAKVTTPGVTVDARKDGSGSGPGTGSGSGAGLGAGARSGRAAGQPAVAVLLFADNREARTVPCEGRAVEVTGNRNELTLTGTCASVRVSGNKNTVTVDAVARVATPGNENTVVYRELVDDRAPRVSNTGKENRIRRAEP